MSWPISLLELLRIAKRRMRTVASSASIVLLGVLALVCIVNSFAGHLTPDNSIYLLHARTFVGTLDRFTLSHDSKGIMLTLALAPAVLVFGPSMAAAASAQLVAYGIGVLCIYWLVRSYTSPVGAVIVALLSLCIIFSHLLWGGNARPEDFAFAYTAVAILAAFRRTPRWLAVGGAMTACCLFTKTSLVLAPGAVLIAGCVILWARTRCIGSANGSLFAKRAARGLLWVGIGFALFAVAMLAWIARFDSLHGWFRQTIQWPSEYRSLSVPGLRQMLATALLIRRANLDYLLALALPGLMIGWLKGPRRLSTLAAVALAAELFRVAVEGARWPYTLTVMVIPMLIGSSMFGLARNESRRLSFLGWMVPLYCLIPVLLATAYAEGMAFRYRVFNRIPSPYEHLATVMRDAGYRPGDPVFVAGNDFQIILLLRAPRPYPVLPLHYHSVSQPEKSATRQYYKQHPPEWVVRKASRPKSGKLPIKGGVDYAYHVFFAAEDASVLADDPAEVRGSGLSSELPESAEYRKVIDTGVLQVWRLTAGTMTTSGREDGTGNVKSTDRGCLIESNRMQLTR